MPRTVLGESSALVRKGEMMKGSVKKHEFVCGLVAGKTYGVNRVESFSVVCNV